MQYDSLERLDATSISVKLTQLFSSGRSSNTFTRAIWISIKFIYETFINGGDACHVGEIMLKPLSNIHL
jgi:hypothetical protein